MTNIHLQNTKRAIENLQFIQASDELHEFALDCVQKGNHSPDEVFELFEHIGLDKKCVQHQDFWHLLSYPNTDPTSLSESQKERYVKYLKTIAPLATHGMTVYTIAEGYVEYLPPDQACKWLIELWDTVDKDLHDAVATAMRRLIRSGIPEKDRDVLVKLMRGGHGEKNE